MNKAHIDKLVNIWIDGMLSVSRDAGWGGDSIIAMIIEYGVSVHTGNDQSNESMIRAIDFLRKEHAEFKKIDVILKDIIYKNNPAVLAIVAKHKLRGLNPDSGSAWTDADRCKTLGQTFSTYRYNLGLAYDLIDSELDRFERYTSAA